MHLKVKDNKRKTDLPLESSLLHGPAQSAYNKTEKAASTESGVCRVFGRAPVAGRKMVLDQTQTYNRY